jgi:hypothetical protein
MKRARQAGSLCALIVERHVAGSHSPIELALEGIELRPKNGQLKLAGGRGQGLSYIETRCDVSCHRGLS